jgi:hypothetical protein
MPSSKAHSGKSAQPTLASRPFDRNVLDYARVTPHQDFPPRGATVPERTAPASTATAAVPGVVLGVADGIVRSVAEAGDDSRGRPRREISLLIGVAAGQHKCCGNAETRNRTGASQLIGAGRWDVRLVDGRKNRPSRAPSPGAAIMEQRTLNFNSMRRQESSRLSPPDTLRRWWRCGPQAGTCATSPTTRWIDSSGQHGQHKRRLPEARRRPYQPAWSSFARSSAFSAHISFSISPRVRPWFPTSMGCCRGLPTARSIQFAAQKARTVYGAFGSIMMS